MDTVFSKRKVLQVCWWENTFEAPMQTQLKEKENNELAKIGIFWWIDTGNGKKLIRELWVTAFKGNIIPWKSLQCKSSRSV